MSTLTHVYTVYKAKYQHYTRVTSCSMSTCVPMHLNRAINIDNYDATLTCTCMSAITKRLRPIQRTRQNKPSLNHDNNDTQS